MSKMWALLAHLTQNWGGEEKKPWVFDEDAWKAVVNECEKYRINTIVLELNDGIEYKSHPEISLPGAWSQEHLKAEIARCKEKGITIIPKLNFATPHDVWMGDYHKMISTDLYYKVCKDLITEVSRLFDAPEYFHLGMDEESEMCIPGCSLVIFRQPPLIWHDLRFLMDCVRENGSMPWIWHNWLFEHPEEYRKHFTPEDAILSPYHYNAFRKEHFTPITVNTETAAYYMSGEFAGKNIQFVEEDPFFEVFHAQAIPNAKLGFRYVPCASVYNRCPYNHLDLVEHFRDNAPDSCLVGFMTGPWRCVTQEHLQDYLDSVRLLDEARREFYPDDN